MNTPLRGRPAYSNKADTPVNRVQVQEHNFSVDAEYQALSNSTSIGAVVTFVGKVRDMNLGDDVTGLSLEHYPGMTEKSLERICEEAEARWPIDKLKIIHRVGDLNLGDQIVFVGVASAHRGAAFEACEFIMDFLKTKAPFWKKERMIYSSRWIEAKDSDSEAADRWN
ncbi:molybdopterin synthase catalytic subunit [Vibrio sp. 10N.286.49.B3]|uniref:molybdopterin synthase catalytic subunit MoaE n=1 Tax=Vibrio sp. 10N.286.49.B3 TaxID=1880855 RepID=UPI000C82DF57|nr:molybdopterin synthase catalytic subunit MoaE [Vibrio sp. 10N.286.49.B3]PMH41910.1 molybdopterin synthase catalytic subunit [Vibrio sp. 10N.286.49.B3]